MKKIASKIIDRNIEIVALTTKEVLLSLFDLVAPAYEISYAHRQSINSYIDGRDADRKKFFQQIQYLKRQGYIETFTKNKEKFAELTAKGIKYTQNLLLDNINISSNTRWDYKWRVIIFDIPEKKFRAYRDTFRHTLNRLKFIQVQKSVYVYPFECTTEISTICNYLNIEKYVTIMISEIIQGEELIIETFLDYNILTKKDLKS